MLYIKYDANGRPELHGDSNDQILNAFAQLQSQAYIPPPIEREAKSQSVRVAMEPTKRKVTNAHFNPEPGTSFGDRSEKALTEIGVPSGTKEVFEKICELDPSFKPTGKTPIHTVRIAMTRDGKKRFVRIGDKWGLTVWGIKDVTLGL